MRCLRLRSPYLPNRPLPFIVVSSSMSDLSWRKHPRLRRAGSKCQSKSGTPHLSSHVASLDEAHWIPFKISTNVSCTKTLSGRPFQTRQVLGSISRTDVHEHGPACTRTVNDVSGFHHGQVALASACRPSSGRNIPSTKAISTSRHSISKPAQDACRPHSRCVVRGVAAPGPDRG